MMQPVVEFKDEETQTLRELGIAVFRNKDPRGTLPLGMVAQAEPNCDTFSGARILFQVPVARESRVRTS